MRKVTPSDELSKLAASSVSDETEQVPWEEIDTGRYQPRRIRGSCRGRVLG